MEGGPNLRALLYRRRDELLKLRSQAQAHIRQIEEELANVEKAADAVELRFDTEVTPKAIDTLDPPVGMTMKEAALTILETHPSGLTANEIRALMRDMYNLKYERSSLSPQLSRLKYDGFITRRDGRWLLPRFLREQDYAAAADSKKSEQ